MQVSFSPTDMRTTLEIRDSVLQAAREEAARRNTSVGEVISNWAERGIYAPLTLQQPRAEYKSGIRQLPGREDVITNEHINKLRDELGV
jgi:hypothetical protein